MQKKPALTQQDLQQLTRLCQAEQQACRLCRYVGGTLTDPVLQTALTGLVDKHYERFNNLLNVLRD